MAKQTLLPPARVVAVDDRADLLDLYEVLFDGTRYQLVARAADGQAGVAAVREHQPDIVLMDLSMPTMDGLEAIPEVRRAAPGCHVIVVSGFGWQRLAPVAMDLGATGYIEKGTRPIDFLHQLDSFTADPPPPFHAPTQALIERARQLV